MVGANFFFFFIDFFNKILITLSLSRLVFTFKMIWHKACRSLVLFGAKLFCKNIATMVGWFDAPVDTHLIFSVSLFDNSYGWSHIVWTNHIDAFDAASTFFGSRFRVAWHVHWTVSVWFHMVCCTLEQTEKTSIMQFARQLLFSLGSVEAILSSIHLHTSRVV